MKALILSKALLTVEPGSIVEISEGQYKALGSRAVAYKEEAKAVEDPATETEAKDIAEETEEPCEIPEEPAIQAEEPATVEKTSRKRSRRSED